MAFKKKTWTDRVAEFINRRTLTKEDGSTELVTVARSEGTISKEGDAFNAETMNDLEQRIEDGIESLNEDLAKLNANLNNVSASINKEAVARNAEDVKLAASIVEVAASANTANTTALLAVKARTKNVTVAVSNGIATIPFSTISEDITALNYVDAIVDIFSSNDYVKCRKWQNGTNIYAFIRNHDGTVLTSGNLTFQVTAFITM